MPQADDDRREPTPALARHDEHEHDGHDEAGDDPSLDELIQRIHAKFDDLTSDMARLQRVAEGVTAELTAIKRHLGARGRVA